ncbi:MAG: hypothetical protein GXO74_04840 [Calditrichaeota bacterium]|nr:hypothetical protein [Calditrichota bacterium]
MTEKSKQILFWLPRILTILFALFISIFAVDVFREYANFWKALGTFLIHLIPTFLVIIALIIAWKREWIGTVIFFGLSIWYMYMAYGKFPLVTYVIICGPMILIAALFLVNWIYRKELRENI